MKYFFNMITPSFIQVKQQEIQFSDLLLQQPLCRTDLAPGEFYLFPKLKGQYLSCDEEMKSAVRKWFQKQNTNWFWTN